MEFKLKNLTVVAPDDLGKELQEEAEKQQVTVSAGDAEALLKEIQQWLAVEREQVLNKATAEAEKALKKQWGGLAGEPAIPVGPRLPQPGVGVGGVVASPNLPTWLTGVPQAQAAVQQISVASVVETVVAALQEAINNLVAQVAKWVTEAVGAVSEQFESAIDRLVGSLDEAVEAQRRVVDELRGIAAEKREEAPLPELPPELPAPGEAPAVPEEVGAPAEVAPPAGPAGEVPAPEVTGEMGEEAEGAGGEEIAPEEERAARPVPAAGRPAAFPPLVKTEGSQPRPAGVNPFDLSFVQVLSDHLSKVTNQILREYEGGKESKVEEIKKQTAFDVAELLRAPLDDFFAKASNHPQKKGKVHEDLTEPVVTAKKDGGHDVMDAVDEAKKQMKKKGVPVTTNPEEIKGGKE